MSASLLPYPVRRQSWLKPGLQLTHMTRVCVCVLQAREGKQDSPLLGVGSSVHGIHQSGDVLLCGSTAHLAQCL